MIDYANKNYLKSPVVKQSIITRLWNLITHSFTPDYSRAEQEWTEKQVRVEKQLRELRLKLEEQQRMMFAELKESERNIDNAKRLWHSGPTVLKEIKK